MIVVAVAEVPDEDHVVADGRDVEEKTIAKAAIEIVGVAAIEIVVAIAIGGVVQGGGAVELKVATEDDDVAGAVAAAKEDVGAVQARVGEGGVGKESVLDLTAAVRVGVVVMRSVTGNVLKNELALVVIALAQKILIVANPETIKEHQRIAEVAVAKLTKSLERMRRATKVKKVKSVKRGASVAAVEVVMEMPSCSRSVNLSRKQLLRV